MHNLTFVRTALAFAVVASLATAAEKSAPPATKETIAEVAKRPLLPPTLTSGLGVPAGETFHLGERMTGDFTTSAKNIGKVAVTILAKRGERIEKVGVVKPGETVVRKFESGDGVLVRNESLTNSAKLTVEVWGAQNLAMYYVPNNEDGEAEH